MRKFWMVDANYKPVGHIELTDDATDSIEALWESVSIIPGVRRKGATAQLHHFVLEFTPSVPES